MNKTLIAVLILFLYFSPVFYQLFFLIKESKEERKRAYKKLLKILKISFIVLTPIVLIIITLNHTNYLNYSKPISYEKFNRITFKDFKGLEFFEKTHNGYEEFAYIVTTISYEVNNDNVVIVKSLFHPSRSFVYNRNSENKELLTHELYHFKITELYARKAREKIAGLSVTSNKKINVIKDKIWNNERQFQKQYDYDTYHSYVYSEQKRYEKDIDSLLSLFDDYKNPKINVKK